MTKLKLKLKNKQAKMIYIFTWNSNFLIQNAIKKWKNQFIEKYGEFNFSKIKELNNLEINVLKENILSESFFWEKKLVILDLNNDLKDEITESILKILENKPENNIIILNYFSPDKRKKFWKNLVKLAELKEFNISDENDTKKIINWKFPWKIESEALNLLIKYKSNNLEKIFSEIEKFLITKDIITKKDIEENTIPELEESIFQIVDLLLNKQKIESIQKIWTILNDTNIFAFYNNLLSNLRTSLFILKLKSQKAQNSEIWKILDLWNRSFLINKNYKISYEELKKFYISLVEIDKKMKTWKFVSSEEDDIKMEVEKCIMKI